MIHRPPRAEGCSRTVSTRAAVIRSAARRRAQDPADCDNGHGIRVADLPVSARVHHEQAARVRRSKAISTYGFRGEALASITHVAMQITSKRRTSLAHAGPLLTESSRLCVLVRNRPEKVAGVVGRILVGRSLQCEDSPPALTRPRQSTS